MAQHIRCNAKASDLDELEAEITSMRENGNPDQETEIIKKELECLKKYCDKLSNIQQENDELKREIEYLKKQLAKPIEHVIEKSCSTVATQMDESMFVCSPEGCKKIEQKLVEARARIEELEDLVNTARDSVICSAEYKALKSRSDQLDQVQKEKEELQRLLDCKCNLEDKLRMMKRRADDADDLERQIKSLKDEINELERFRKKAEFLAQELRSIREENNCC